jgi:MYXO-CTERM domain-containing protein
MTHGLSPKLRLRLVVLAGVATLAVAPAAWAQNWVAATLPADGNISGDAGQRIGWGYQINNPDATLWLVLTSVAADAFNQATAEVLFDLPVLAPGNAVSQPFAGADGLVALTWDALAAPGFVNSGVFELAAEWWSGDPLAGGAFVVAAPTLQLDYSAIVATPVPEATPASMLLLGLAALALARRKSSP